MAETQTIIGKIINIAKWKPENRNSFFVICALLYFGYRDYQREALAESLIKGYVDLAERERTDKTAVQLKYDKLLDRTIFRQDKQNDINDSLENWAKRIEAKLPQK